VVTLAGLSSVGLLIAVLPSLPGGDAILRAAVAHVPGAGLLRDSQKWIAPLVLLEALLAGAAVERLAERVRAAVWRPALVVAALAVPLILLPDAPATLRPTLDPVHYPHDWTTVAARLDGDDVVVLPFGSYRSFPWAPQRTVLDPAPRFFRGRIVVDDRLAVSGRLLRGENPRARAVAAALSAGPDLPRRLARLGIRWVIVELDTPGTVPNLTGLDAQYAGSRAALYRVPGPITQQRTDGVDVAVVLIGDGLAVLSLLVLAVAGTTAGRRRSRGTVQDQGPRATAVPSV
jgi:hypothetical protein